MLSINTNLSSLITQNSMNSATNKLNQAIERMTTGFKINHAKDNAANYSIATNMTTKIGAYQVAQDNAEMGMDLVTTASDTISLMQDKATRLHALSMQARNGTYGAQSLAAINTEASAIMDEINRLYYTAQYNGISLFTGGSTGETPAIATFATPRATSSGFIEEVVERDTSSMVTMTQLVNGTTSVTDEYSISTKEELVALANYVNSGNDTTDMTFVLAKDIDLSSISNWTPIGFYDYDSGIDEYFKGVFDGNGHVIKNLTIDNETGYIGLFGQISDGAEIKNVGLLEGSIKSSNSVGFLVGYSEYAFINNCYATGSVSGNKGVGGLVGTLNYSSISNSYTTGTVTGEGDEYIGGLIGSTEESSISNSYATGNVKGNLSIGGLIGGSYESSISNSYATGTVTSDSLAGGLVATIEGGSIRNCYATGTVSGTDSAGGLVGNNIASVSNSYATGTVSGTDSVGGLVGYNNASVSNSYATGTVSGTNYVGGLVGQNLASVSNCVATQVDANATLMTEEEIKSISNLESMGFTEANGWTIVNGVPLQSWQKETQPVTPGSGATGVSSFTLQIGINSDSSSQIGFDSNFTYDLSEIGADISSDSALAQITDFINLLSEKQTMLGAVQNRLESALDSISVNIENLTSSRSTIRDADIAEVSSIYIQQQILQQASATLMSTANQSPAIALQLI